MIKRAGDLFVAVPALLLLSPLLAIIAVLVAVALGRPVIFRQERPGRGARMFSLFKFRTMTDARDEHGALLPDAVRLTGFGRWLRSTSLDELPQLLNVVRGDLSLVGPRPLLARYLAHYTSDQARRHDVRPGMTGWAQVNGRNSVSWDDRLALDTWYVDHRSVPLDIRILWKTLGVVLTRSGTTSAGSVTMTPFDETRGSAQRSIDRPDDAMRIG